MLQFGESSMSRWRQPLSLLSYKLRLWGLSLVLSTLSITAFGGASSSQWVIVVNGDSRISRTIANHYCAMRNIPANNVIVLYGIPERDRITVDEFREKILGPILKQIDDRGLAGLVQGVAYSGDFPTSVDINADVSQLPNRSEYLLPVGSINGLTYLYKMVMAKDGRYIAFDANSYARRPFSTVIVPPLLYNKRLDKFDELNKQRNWEAMAELLGEQIKDLPRELRAPQHLLIALYWAKAQETQKALNAVEQAILTGWDSREWIETQADFESLKELKEFGRLLKICPQTPANFTAARSFDARTFYAQNTLSTQTPEFGTPYLMSVMLGVTRDLGMSQTEVLTHLQRSVAADYRPLRGTFFLMKSTDVRTKTREPFFDMTVSRLKEKGFSAVVSDGVLPPKRSIVAGLTMGSAEFSLRDAQIDLQAGSIAENLTSLGGVMNTEAQVKLTEFLLRGAAISSGTVYEPYTIPGKFPHPMIHDSYTDGLTAAEAYYSSVTCPYQLLIAGDPLCQPFAKPPRFEVDGGVSNVDRSQKLKLRLKIADSAGSEPETCWISLDGRFEATGVFENNLEIGFGKTAPGFHEIRIGTQSSAPLRHSFEQTVSIWLNDDSLWTEGNQPQWDCERTFSSYNKTRIPIKLLGKFPEGEIQLWNQSELVTTIPAGATSIPFESRKFGYGPVKLQLRIQTKKGTTILLNSKIVEIQL